MMLITGATGFIGKNLVPKLCRDIRLKILARKTSNLTHFTRSRNIQIVFGDLEKNQGLPEALEAVDTVVHCAARTIGKDFSEYYRTNTLGTLHLVQAMQHTGVRRIVFLSSHAACGPTRDMKIIDEQVLPRPVSHYGKSKELAENIIKNSGLDHIILRPAAVYGPYDTDVLKYIKLVNTGICPIVGFGEKYVNLLHVDDLVRLITNIVHTQAFTQKTYFVHDGQSYAYSTVLKTIADILETRYCIVRIPVGIALMVGLGYDVFVRENYRTVWRDKVRELAGTHWLCCQNEVSQDFNFVPHYDLSRGMKQTIDWYRINHLL
jgi:nucleoside-diphosphate-sugar epimerase